MVQLVIGMLFTLASVVLGLLTFSVKGGFDKASADLAALGSNIIRVDQLLRDYGPEADPIRTILRELHRRRDRQHLDARAAAAGQTIIRATWPATKAGRLEDTGARPHAGCGRARAPQARPRRTRTRRNSQRMRCTISRR